MGVVTVGGDAAVKWCQTRNNQGSRWTRMEDCG